MIQTPKSFWTYQAATPTPSLDDAINSGAITLDTIDQWEALSPGMRREIVKFARHSTEQRENR